MGLLFNTGEVFRIAVRIEENGERFYREMSKRLADPQVKELFEDLADEEVKHREFYEALLAEAGGVEAEEGSPGEYFAYLLSYADGIIFSQEVFEKRLKEITDEAGALEFAIGVEWDSINYYRELKGLVPESQRQRLNDLIAEERRHFVTLTRLKKEKNY